MQWDLTESSLGVHRRDQEARWKYVGRSPEEDHKTHRKNAGLVGVFGRLMVAEPPVPYFHGAFDGCTVGVNK
ncbi:hypothetical protein GW17_00046547 [Ensete ventricosum]|nr:hypothetical protein GW17_00046547 [Ensete ventricosum]